jgi:hypothetical protein
MVRRSQLSIEFVAATMIFLFALVLVVSAIFRGFTLVSDSQAAGLLNARVEAVLESLVGSPGNGFANGRGELDYAKLEAVPAGNYSALRDFARFREDYRISITYLPSLIVTVFFENPLAKGSGQNATTFETFSNSTPIGMAVSARSLSGAESSAEISPYLSIPRMSSSTSGRWGRRDGSP